MSKKQSDNQVQSVGRALAILEHVVAAGEIGVSELGRALGLHVATVHNLVQTLTAQQYLQNVNGRYRPGVSLAILLAHSSPMTLLARLAQPALESITRATGEAASLTVLTDKTARLIAFQPGTHLITMQHPQWVWEDPLQLATGSVLLAFAAEPLRSACIQHHLTLDESESAATWEQRLSTIRATSETETLPPNPVNRYAFACAVRGPQQEVLAAIGANCPDFRAIPTYRTLIQEAVRAAARSLTDALCKIKVEKV